MKHCELSSFEVLLCTNMEKVLEKCVGACQYHWSQVLLQSQVAWLPRREPFLIGIRQLRFWLNMEQTPDGNYFRDPFESFYCKILATLAYMAGLPGCCIAACFIWYEGTGRAGPFRTCVNQLVSNIYFLVNNCNSYYTF